MFQFRRFPTNCYLIHKELTEYCSAGFPHSDIPGSRAAFASPRLFVDRYVLHRLPMPRHPPCALISLTFFPFASFGGGGLNEHSFDSVFYDHLSFCDEFLDDLLFFCFFSTCSCFELSVWFLGRNCFPYSFFLE